MQLLHALPGETDACTDVTEGGRGIIAQTIVRHHNGA
jgi:hypothetical protein